MIKQNPYILSILEPNRCYKHDWDIRGVDTVCNNCGYNTDRSYGYPSDYEPDYYTATGIQDIMAWFTSNYAHSKGFAERLILMSGFRADSALWIQNVYTNPEKFCNKFVAYAKENKLGDLSLIQEEEK